MKNNCLFKLLKTLIYPFIFGIGELIIAVIFSQIYRNNISKTFTNDELFKAFLETSEYSDGLTTYMSEHLIYIILITLIIFLPLFICKYNKYKIKTEFKLKSSIYLIIPSVCLAILLNLIIINYNKLFSITNTLSDNKYLIITLISSGIVGPILEEYLFRGIVYNELKTFNNEKVSMWLSIIIFALFHNTFSQICYAFIIGYVLIKLYIKTHSLICTSIFHMISNITVSLFINSLISLNIILSILLIIVLLIIFIFSYKFMYKKI